jgi:hypothetical protein
MEYAEWEGSAAPHRMLATTINVILTYKKMHIVRLQTWAHKTRLNEQVSSFLDSQPDILQFCSQLLRILQDLLNTLISQITVQHLLHRQSRR